jgi:glycosidase
MSGDVAEVAAAAAEAGERLISRFEQLRGFALAAFVLVAGCAGSRAAVSESPSTDPVGISAPAGPLEARLPCNRAGSQVCDLRIYHVMTGTSFDGDSTVGPRAAWGPGPHRGDIRGVIGALDAIKAAGFNAVWLTPVHDSRAGEPQARADGGREVDLRLDGTGYFPRDYFAVDPQFGTAADLDELAREARARGIGLILDGVLGHHKGDPVASPSGRRPVGSRTADDYGGAIADYPGEVTDWRRPETRAFYREYILHWTERLGLTGWRLDQAYQVPPDGWAELAPLVQAQSRQAGGTGAMIGEIWGSADEIIAVLGSNTAPGLPSAFDFPTRYAILQALAVDEGGKRGPASAINEAWAMGSHARWPDHAIPALMLGNHDLVRFGDLVQRAGLGGPQDDGYWARHQLAFLFMTAWSGPVTVYYGEEIGDELPEFAAKVTGRCWEAMRCDDHVARTPARVPGLTALETTFDPRALALRREVGNLMRLRDREPALSRGARQHLFSDATAYVDLKRLDGRCAVLALNTGTGARTLRISPSALGLASVPMETVQLAGSGRTRVVDGSLLLELDGLGGAIAGFPC